MNDIECKYREWLREYNFENCKLNRGEYGAFLKNYLVGELDGFVLNLNGSWGSGKTEFLRRLYSLLIVERHPTIYIDAWESDFSQVPLSVVSSELINQLSLINQNIGNDLDKLSSFLGKALKGTIIGGAAILSKQFLGEASVGAEMAKALFEQSPTDFIKSITSEHAEQVDAIKQIRHELEILAEVINRNYNFVLPVVVLVDELDRCRPNYAIEMLEVIKHFFTTKNFVFVIATDTEQLRKSIKSVYGADFDSSTYLKRFFNREARLDAPDLYDYIRLSPLDFSSLSDKVILYPRVHASELESVHKYLSWLASAYSLSLRDVDQLISKLNACIRHALNVFDTSGKVQLINVFSLIVAIIEFDKEYPEFALRCDGSPYINVKMDASISVDEPIYKTTIRDLYQFNMHCSVMHEISFKDSWGENATDLVYGTHSKSEFGGLTPLRGILKKTERSVDEIFRLYKVNGKIWMWKEYQRVVKLAGNIE